MTKNLASALIILSCLSSPLYAKSINSVGFQTIKQESIEDLNHAGMLSIRNSTVQGKTQVNGMLNGDRCTFSGMQINGEVDLESCRINRKVSVNGKLEAESSEFLGPLNVNGHIEAEDSQFKDTITLTGTHAEFENCSLKSLIFKPTKKKLQKVQLETTHITGDIIFEDGNGIVKMDSKSTISGQVKGGKIQKS